MGIFGVIVILAVIIVLLLTFKNKKSKRLSSMTTVVHEMRASDLNQNVQTTAQRFCVGCGKTLSQGALFCPECGTKNDTNV